MSSVLSDERPWMTICVVAIVLIVTIVGGIVVITNPQTLSFDQYVTVLTGLAIGSGLLGIGRGIASQKNTEDVLRDIAQEFQEQATPEPKQEAS